MKKSMLAGIAVAALMLSAGLANAQIKLGVAGPITGPNAAFGAQLKNGVEQAVEDINAAGGILGQKITVSIGDDVSDPKQGVSVANKFVGDGVKFVVRSLSGKRHDRGDTVCNQSKADRAQNVERVPHLRS